MAMRGRKRSILVRFREPVTSGEADFAADVTVGINNPYATGLFMTRYSSWDRSHPEAHTEMVLQAVKDTRVANARIVRLLKHWNRSKGNRAAERMCRWALAPALVSSRQRTTRPEQWSVRRRRPHFTVHLKHGVVVDLPAVATVVTDPTERRRVRGVVMVCYLSMRPNPDPTVKATVPCVLERGARVRRCSHAGSGAVIGASFGDQLHGGRSVPGPLRTLMTGALSTSRTPGRVAIDDVR